MMLVDQNRLKGNYGAALVAQMLSQRCLVRPVAEGTDIGVDLYCESVTKDGRPFQHFWVQVKTGSQVRVAPDGQGATVSFDWRHLEYWDRQPVPVFALLVPLDVWPPQPPDHIYVVDVTGHLLTHGPPTQGEITLHSHKVPDTIKPGDIERLEWFLYEHVPSLTGAQKIRDGIIDFTESPEGDRYVRRLISGFTLRFVDRVVDAIRRTAAIGSLDLMITGSPQDPVQIRYWEFLLCILKKCDELGLHHYEHEVAYGRAALLKGDLPEARRFRESALAGIEADIRLNEADRKPMRDFVERYLPEKALRDSQA